MICITMCTVKVECATNCATGAIDEIHKEFNTFQANVCVETHFRYISTNVIK